MTLTLTSPTTQPTVAIIDLQKVVFDYVNGAAVVTVAIKDASGNMIRYEDVVVPQATAATWLSTLKTAVYTHLQTKYGAGTVT